MQKKNERGSVEERVTRRAKRNQIRNVILLSAYVAVGASMIVMMPNAVRLLKHVEKIVGPSPRLKRRVNQKYSELISQGIFRRINIPGGSRIELTEKGMKIAEELSQYEDVRPIQQKKWDQKWRIIMFDVWERRRNVRDELRQTLKEFGFIKIQDSAWAYPYPCEKLLVFLRTHLKLGRGILYVVADEIEHDEQLRLHFKLHLQH
ncbi:hypothetical protein A2118_04110 [Candidatus Kaiserbacteria bacterium GWA2_50_9]|uniref:Transcriptional repressor PaaX-like central Cas2-like domain-containing protein n=1 Tax=Candidatus Kaiserbacteria bacterium GWA2_50_9 TaxID=1798474 RepID=A0A1F6BUE0_9BACT|nr:MAG: hypothetical protein A2118_04110 [Candidatus Kaiserbacteria bacterium GWA2_50_9]